MANYLDSTGLALVLTKIKEYVGGAFLAKGGLAKINGASLENGGDITVLTQETDPVFQAHPAYGITADKMSKWDSAVSGIYDDTELKNRVVALEDAGYLTEESQFNASVAKTITSENISAWNSKQPAMTANVDYATPGYVATEIGKMSHIDFKIVDSVEDVTEAGHIYLIPAEGSKTNDVYNEYAFISGKAEIIGSTKVDIEAIPISDITTILTNAGF